MRRLYFLAPEIKTAHAIVDELLEAGVTPRRIHLLAREGLALDELPEDVERYGELSEHLRNGAAAGGKIGLLAGLAALAMPAGPILAGGTILLLAMAGAGVGAVAGALIGKHVHDPELKHFEAAVAGGEILLLVDIERNRLEEVEKMIQRHHPGVKIAGTEPKPGA